MPNRRHLDARSGGHVHPPVAIAARRPSHLRRCSRNGPARGPDHPRRSCSRRRCSGRSRVQRPFRSGDGRHDVTRRRRRPQRAVVLGCWQRGEVSLLVPVSRGSDVQPNRQPPTALRTWWPIAARPRSSPGPKSLSGSCGTAFEKDPQRWIPLVRIVRTIGSPLTLAESHPSMSLCLSVREMTVYRRSTEATGPTPGAICADMELGANVAQMRALVTAPRATCCLFGGGLSAGVDRRQFDRTRTDDILRQATNRAKAPPRCPELPTARTLSSSVP